MLVRGEPPWFGSVRTTDNKSDPYLKITSQTKRVPAWSSESPPMTAAVGFQLKSGDYSSDLPPSVPTEPPQNHRPTAAAPAAAGRQREPTAAKEQRRSPGPQTTVKKQLKWCRTAGILTGIPGITSSTKPERSNTTSCLDFQIDRPPAPRTYHGINGNRFPLRLVEFL